MKDEEILKKLESYEFLTYRQKKQLGQLREKLIYSKNRKLKQKKQTQKQETNVDLINSFIMGRRKYE